VTVPPICHISNDLVESYIQVIECDDHNVVFMSDGHSTPLCNQHFILKHTIIIRQQVISPLLSTLVWRDFILHSTEQQATHSSTMMAKQVATVVLVVALSTVATFLNYYSVETTDIERGLATTSPESNNELPKYDQSSIEALLHDTGFHRHHSFQTSVLVFDGHDFLSYDLGNQDPTSRSVKLIPFMVHALKTNFPDRFQPGQPVFQLPWTGSDFLSTECVNEDQECSETKDLPPIVSYGSMYKDEHVLPTAKGFPNPQMMECLYEYQFVGVNTCHWENVDESLAWDDLISTIIWRGTDFRHFTHSYKEHSEYAKPWIETIFNKEFVTKSNKTDVVDTFFQHFHRLTPRWRAVVWTLRTKLLGGHNWIDCMFIGSWKSEDHVAFTEAGIPVADNKRMSEFEMSKYRYQIDFGGGMYCTLFDQPNFQLSTFSNPITRLFVVTYRRRNNMERYFSEIANAWSFVPPRNQDEGLVLRFDGTMETLHSCQGGYF
jgi:hypothetical protein